MSSRLHTHWHNLHHVLSQHLRVLVAFSGGADSTLLVAAAKQILGRENVLAVTAISASLPEREKRATEELASYIDVPFRAIQTAELNKDSYTTNPSNRCYFCKDELFEKLSPLARDHGMQIIDGFNASDRADYRPGFQASQKWQVVHPLDEAHLYKRDIRILSRWMKLPTWNKPASPCLSSRIPYGTTVTPEILKQIEWSEETVRQEGFRIVRVRHHGSQARVEVPIQELPKLLEEQRWNRIVTALQGYGYQEVVADPRGFESGRLNEALRIPNRA